MVQVVAPKAQDSQGSYPKYGITKYLPPKDHGGNALHRQSKEYLRYQYQKYALGRQASLIWAGSKMLRPPI